ncbi:MAG: hypothetical protein GDA49_02070 [Rhodospirillales bacterium]|nr:hypothetical protein [Rhodospirillales bacterium]
MGPALIAVECIDVLAARAGIGDTIADITARTIRGELEFGQSPREQVRLLEGASEALPEAAF